MQANTLLGVFREKEELKKGVLKNDNWFDADRHSVWSRVIYTLEDCIRKNEEHESGIDPMGELSAEEQLSWESEYVDAR